MSTLMRRAFVVLGLLAVLIAGCAGATAPGQNVAGGGLTSAVKYQHDDAHKVGCWFIVGTSSQASISCLPDKDYQP